MQTEASKGFDTYVTDLETSLRINKELIAVLSSQTVQFPEDKTEYVAKAYADKLREDNDHLQGAH